MVATVLAGGLLAACAPLIADDSSGKSTDWPRWRGPNGDGVSNETDWTSDWPADGPKQLWTAKIGVGFGSIAVADGRAYVMGHKRSKAKHGNESAKDGDATDADDKNKDQDDEKKAKQGEDFVWCFDAATGREIWHYSYPCKLVDNLHEGGPAATPTVDGNHVYTLSKEGHLFCFDAAKGNVVWKAELQKLFDVDMPAWGFSGSPQVFGDKLILDAGPTVALNKNTGEVIWKTEKFSVGYGSPTFFSLGGEPLAAVLNNDFLLVVRIKDGSIVDKTPWKSPFSTNATTPIVELTDKGAAIFVSTGYGTGCGLYDLADGKLTERYKNKNMRNHMATCVPRGDVLFGFDGQSSPSSQAKLVALNRDSGEVLWKQRGLGCGTLLRAGERLIILSDDGRLVIAEASDKEYKELASAKVLEGKCWTVPILAAGRIYCRNAAGELVCVDVHK